MGSLLVLGSKPDPQIPPLTCFNDVACANASGFSAMQHGLPSPRFTVISSIVVSGKNESNRQALRALAGLTTDRVYLFPRRPYRKKLWKQLLHPGKMIRTTAPFAAETLRRSGYHFEELVSRSVEAYLHQVIKLAGDDIMLGRLLTDKVPSVGVLAVVLGLADYSYDRIVLSGFSFEITHAHAVNPLIRERGSATSRHADTDVMVLKLIAQQQGRLFTTEPVVHERTGIPMLKQA